MCEVTCLSLKKNILKAGKYDRFKMKDRSSFGVDSLADEFEAQRG